MDTCDSFPQFKDLPLELRRQIWMFCLPRRIAEEDFPYTLLDGKDSRQACWPNHSIFQNARVPLLASVCAEAREVVFEYGKHQESYHGTSLKSRWIQVKIDQVLHLNWTRRRNDAFYEVYNVNIPEVENSALEEFLCRAIYVEEMPASIVAEVLYPFDLRELMESRPTPEPESFPSAIANLPTGPVYQEASEHDLRDIMVLVDGGSIYTTLLAISIHINGVAALSSGLFGLSADSPVQMVDVDDIPQLRQFYKLFNSDPTLKEAEPYVEKLFDVIFSPNFLEAVISWQKKVRWLLQVAVWKNAQIHYLKTFGGTDPRSIWTPPIPVGQYDIKMNDYMPNEDYPWWNEYAEKNIPKVVPQIMMRLCDNQCYETERLPEMFGEISWYGGPGR